MRNWPSTLTAGVAIDSTFEHAFNMYAAEIHLVFEIDHRRAVEMPGQTVTEHATADEFALSSENTFCTV